MLRRYSEVLRSVCMAVDLAIVGIAWLGAYALRFHTGLLPAPPGVHDPADYLALGAIALGVFFVLLRYRGLYEPRRGLSRADEARALLEVSVIGTGVLAATTFFWRDPALSRATMLLFFGLVCTGLIAFRLALRTSLASLRRRGYNVRRVLIVGTGRLARQVYQRFDDHPETGFQVAGVIGLTSAYLDGPPHMGGYDALRGAVQRYAIDHVVIAVDREEPVEPIKLVDALEGTAVTVRIAPDLLGYPTVTARSEDFDGLPMICLVESPILGWDEVVKRGIDLAIAGGGMLVLSPLFAAIAAASKLSEPSAPVFYRQERMSLDGQLFEMFKFRTMVENAESRTGPVWTTQDDPRRTRLGALLRKTNLDELPQLWNIVRGDMSLVGPRPERPQFIRQFRAEFPGYMLRHKVKGGLTGWAQVHGMRGNTSVRQRLDLDLEYARRWSLGLDLRIIALTVIRSFRDPNAY